MFQLGVITDEVSQDFEEALQFAVKHELDCVELRSAWEKGPFEFTDEEFQKIKNLSEQYKVPVTAISSPLFKCSFKNEEEKERHIADLERLSFFAESLGAKMIRGFDFFRDVPVSADDIKAAYERVIPICEKRGITLLLESEPTTNSYNCEKTAAIVDYINSPVVKSLYEPGNDIYSPTDEIPYPDGFEHVRRNFAHVHVKDAVKENGTVRGVAIGQGLVDYEGIIRALLQMDYQGAVMLETHYKPKGIVMDEALLKNPKGSAISFMGDIASEECIVALKKMIRKVRDEK